MEFELLLALVIRRNSKGIVGGINCARGAVTLTELGFRHQTFYPRRTGSWDEKQSELRLLGRK